MELKEKLKKIMEQEFGITTDAELEQVYEALDMSDLGVFVAVEGRSSENAS